MYRSARAPPESCVTEKKRPARVSHNAILSGPVKAELIQVPEERQQIETANSGCHVLGGLGTYDVVFSRHGAAKDCKGMPGGVESQ